MAAVRTILAILVALVVSVPSRASENIELVMVMQEGCPWCERWDEEIWPAYAKTEEGRFAPLRRVDLYDIPEDLTVLRRVIYTPTFLLVHEGRELDRIEGYPGPDFFWPLLDALLTEYTDFSLDEETGG